MCSRISRDNTDTYFVSLIRCQRRLILSFSVISFSAHQSSTYPDEHFQLRRIISRIFLKEPITVLRKDRAAHEETSAIAKQCVCGCQVVVVRREEKPLTMNYTKACRMLFQTIPRRQDCECSHFYRVPFADESTANFIAFYG